MMYIGNINRFYAVLVGLTLYSTSALTIVEKSAPTQPPIKLEDSATWAKVFEVTKSKVVQVFTFGNAYDWGMPFKSGPPIRKCGTGYIASPEGDIYTNFHVGAEADTYFLQHPDIWKEQFELEFVGGSPDYDFMHLRLKPEELERLLSMLPNGKLDYFDLGNSDGLAQGEEIMLIGYPLGGEDIKHAVGTISGQVSNEFGECLTTTAPSYPGNSGGPCIDKNGKIIGILVGGSGQEAQGINFLIPIDKIKVIIDLLVDGNIVRTPFWGITGSVTTPLTFEYLKAPTDAGMFIKNINIGSLAEQAGIVKGDIISTINSFKLDRFGYCSVPWTKYKIFYEDVLARVKYGELVTFEIYRDGSMSTCVIAHNTASPLKIKRYYLPFEKQPEYIVFGGMVIMELALNHYDNILPYIHALLEHRVYFDPTRYLKADNQHTPQLIITYQFPETVLAKNQVFKITDCLIKTVNNIPVQTVQDFYEAVKADTQTGFIVIQTQAGTKVVLALRDLIKQEPNLAKKYNYQLSSLYAELSKK